VLCYTEAITKGIAALRRARSERPVHRDGGYLVVNRRTITRPAQADVDIHVGHGPKPLVQPAGRVRMTIRSMVPVSRRTPQTLGGLRVPPDAGIGSRSRLPAQESFQGL
jgi:hypothetical protein